jgi:hypothetical protein
MAGHQMPALPQRVAEELDDLTRVSRKLGPEIARNYARLNHDVFDNVKEMGVTTRGNTIRLNQPRTFKSTQILAKVHTTGPVRIFRNDMRLDMIEAAKLANVDCTLQIMHNDRLQPTQIWSGKHRGRAPRGRPCGGEDLLHAYLEECRRRGTQVPVRKNAQASGHDPVNYLNNRLAGHCGATQFDLTARRVSGMGPGGASSQAVPVNMIVYSQYLTRNLQNNHRADTFFCDKWPDVVAKLRELHPDDPAVAVCSYAGMQHQEIELSG